MKILKRSLCLALALIMLFTLAACSGKKNEEAVTETTTASEWPVDFSGVDYSGHEFVILRADIEGSHGLTGYPNDIWIEEMGGDVLGNAVYTRNQTLCNMLNITLKMETQDMGVALTNTLEKNTMSSDIPYDLTVLHMRGFPALIEKELVKDMNELKLDTSHSWWDKDAETALNIAGKQYAMISDVTYVDKLNTVGVFLNTNMAANLGLPDFYDMVDNGEWTWAKMKEYAIKAADSGEGVYGISAHYMMHAANITTVAKDGNGELFFRLPYQRPVNILQDVFTVMNENYFFNRQLDGNLSIDDAVKMFGDKNLFLVRPLTSFYFMKNYYDNYGILPLPKMDDSNEGYYSSVNHHAGTLMAVPINNGDNERTANVLQAWGMISEKTVMPEFYDRILSTRMVSDTNGARMLDIIFENRIYDIGLIFNFGGFENTILISDKELLSRAPTTISSSIDGVKIQVNNAIKEFMK